jgi:SAM-dependent methyltransferase
MDLGELRSRLYRALETPWVYTLVQRVSAPGSGRLLGHVAAATFAKSRGLVLDVGCGPRLNTPPPQGRMLGLDINRDYVAEYRLGTDRQGVQGSAAALPFAPESFAEARSWGILHHLPDDVASASIREMARCVEPGGRVVVFDNVWPRRAMTRPVAWLLRKLDRGAWIRSEAALRVLVTDSAAGTWTVRRFTYSLNGMEGLIMTLTLPPTTL